MGQDGRNHARLTRQDARTTARVALRVIALTEPRQCALMLARAGLFFVECQLHTLCHDNCADYRFPTNQDSFLVAF